MTYSGLIVAMFAVILLFFILAEVILMCEGRNPEKSASWLAIYAVCPLLGGIIYFVFGFPLHRNKLFPKKHLPVPMNNLSDISREQLGQFTQDEVFIEESFAAKRLVRLMLKSSLAPMSQANSVTVLTNGQEKFKALLTDIRKAKHHIHVQYYIFNADDIGTKIQELLIAKSRSGVKVRMILDGVGSHKLPKSFIQELKEAGVEIAWFLPLRFPGLLKTINYRNHRKLVVVDGVVGYLGGHNVGDEYLSRDPQYGFWRDTHIRVEGKSVQTMQECFLNDWYFVKREVIDHEGYFPQLKTKEQTLVQIVAGGPDSDTEAMKQLFFTILATAEEEILLTTPYFIPDESMIMALKSAALSGLDVKVIVQGKPDHKISYCATCSYFADLIDSGVKMYRYQKGILHSKVLTVDHKLAIVGSANFDIRSFQLNFELSAIIYNSDVVHRLNQDFSRDLGDSVQVKREEIKNRTSWQKFKEVNARLLSPLL